MKFIISIVLFQILIYLSDNGVFCEKSNEQLLSKLKQVNKLRRLEKYLDLIEDNNKITNLNRLNSYNYNTNENTNDDNYNVLQSNNNELESANNGDDYEILSNLNNDADDFGNNQLNNDGIYNLNVNKRSMKRTKLSKPVVFNGHSLDYNINTYKSTVSFFLRLIRLDSVEKS